MRHTRAREVFVKAIEKNRLGLQQVFLAGPWATVPPCHGTVFPLALLFLGNDISTPEDAGLVPSHRRICCCLFQLCQSRYKE